MKAPIKIALVFGLLVLLFSSCQKEDMPTPSTPIQNEGLSNQRGSDSDNNSTGGSGLNSDGSVTADTAVIVGGGDGDRDGGAIVGGGDGDHDGGNRVVDPGKH